LVALYLVVVFSVAPHVPDPFQTLADIYEAKGDTDKRMQVGFSPVNFSCLTSFQHFFYV